MSAPEDKLEQQAKRLFDESVDNIDAATLSRLNKSRHAAAAVAGKPNRQKYWLPALGAGAAVLLAVVMLRPPMGDADLDAPASDLEILLSEESIDMLEDLDFYSWLEVTELELDGDLG